MVTALAKTAGVAAVVTTVLVYLRVIIKKKKWMQSLRKFTEENDGFKIQGNRSVLFLVNPAAGGGKAMRAFPSCIDAFDKRGFAIEVYITKGTEDVLSLTSTLDFSPYTCIALLAGDSTLTELMQRTFVKHGKWIYAPILCLKGGSGNVVAFELFGKASPSEIIERYENVKSASVIKASSPGKTPRFAVHVIGGGVLVGLLDALEKSRSGLYFAFGEAAMWLVLFYGVLTLPKPLNFALSLLNSDVEGGGIDLGFGVNRFDRYMAVIRADDLGGRFGPLQFFFKFMSGELGKQLREGRIEEGMDLRCESKFSVSLKQPIKMYVDGSRTVTFQSGHSATFEVIPNAIQYFGP